MRNGPAGSPEDSPHPVATAPCPVCEGDGVGRFSEGTCVFCDGAGTVAEDLVPTIVDAAVFFKAFSKRGKDVS